MKSLLFVGALAALSGLAQGAIFFELESNDTPGTANDLGVYGPPGDGILVDGDMNPGDVDWFSITFTGPTDLVASAFALPFSDTSTDGQLMLLDSLFSIVAFDDDDNIGFMPSIQVSGLAAGTYYIGISGYDDGNAAGPLTVFDGIDDSTGAPHTEDWLYKLIIGANVAPAPGGAALVALAGLAGLRRRR